MSGSEPAYKGAYIMLGGKGRYQPTILSILKYVKSSARISRLKLIEYAGPLGAQSKRPSNSSVESSMKTLFHMHFLEDDDGIVSIGRNGEDYLQLEGAQRNRFLAEQLILTYTMYREVLGAFARGAPLTAGAIQDKTLGNAGWATPRQVEIRVDWLRECDCLRDLGSGEHVITDFGRTVAKDFPPLT